MLFCTIFSISLTITSICLDCCNCIPYQYFVNSAEDVMNSGIWAQSNANNFKTLFKPVSETKSTATNLPTRGLYYPDDMFFTNWAPSVLTTDCSETRSSVTTPSGSILKCTSITRNYEKPKILQTTVIQKNSLLDQSSSVRSKKTTISQKNSSHYQSSSIHSKKTTISQKNSSRDQNSSLGDKKTTISQKNSSRNQNSSLGDKKTTISQKNSSRNQNSSLGNKETTISLKNPTFNRQKLTRRHRMSTHTRLQKTTVNGQKFSDAVQMSTKVHLQNTSRRLKKTSRKFQNATSLSKSTHELKDSSAIHQKFVEKSNVAATPATTETFFDYYAYNGEDKL